MQRSFRATRDESAGGLATDDERQTHIASERRGKLQRLLVAPDTRDQILDGLVRANAQKVSA